MRIEQEFQPVKKTQGKQQRPTNKIMSSNTTINNKSSLSKQVSRQHPTTVVSSSSSSDETFKKLIFMTKEYRKMRFELERISNIAIQQHEQMKQQQFTIENMHLYIVKQRDELLQLNSQIKMEKELCEDVIRLKQQESSSLSSLSSSTCINNLDNSSSVNDDLMTMMMMGDDDSAAHQEEVKQMMNRVLGGSNNDIQKYLLLMDDDDESEDTGGHIGGDTSSSDDNDNDNDATKRRRREQLTKTKTFMLEDKVAQLQKENHSLRSEVMQLKDSLFVLQQMEKHRNMATNNNNN